LPLEGRLISLRKQMDESENSELRSKALVKAFVGLINVLPKAALPANPELSKQARQNLDETVYTLKGTPEIPAIDDAGRTALEQAEEIYRANKTALEERDAVIKDVVATVAGAISGFRGNGERHKSNLTKLADGFESLSRVEDVTELRRRLREDVGKLRNSVEEMRRESEEAVQRLQSQVESFEERAEQARKETGIDRLTGLGSRREAERYLQKIPRRERPVCLLLFDIEGFRDINNRHGTLFGDKLLQALAHRLRERFPGEGVLFRWGADEFLVIAEGSLPVRLDQCRGICESFASSGYATAEGGPKKSVSAMLACGGAAQQPGEGIEEWYRRSRESLEQNRRGLRR
jgi:diguanylate cyclase (GGDEF)-like protein